MPGKPLSALRWWRDDVLLDDFYIVTELNFSRNELYLKSLQRKDLFANLTCSVDDANLTVPMASTVIIDMNRVKRRFGVNGWKKCSRVNLQRLSLRWARALSMKPTEVLITTVYRPLREDIPLQIKCLTRGARPPAQVSWWLDDEKLTYPVTELINRPKNLTESTLTLIPHANDAAKKLTCISENVAIPFSYLSDTWLLEIYHPPEEPENCVAVVTAQCLLVQCKKIEDSGAQNFFHLDVFDTRSDKLLTNLTKLQPDFSVCSLPSKAYLLLLLYAINSNGKSNSIIIHANTTCFDGYDNGWYISGSSIVMITIIGAFTLLFVTGIAVSLYKMRASPVASTSLPPFPTNPTSDGGIKSYSNDTTVSMHRSEFPLLSSTSIFKERLEKKTLYLTTRV
ncbi:uncharacterized protein CDAR_548311 [Caerostris darwini]|uniref:Ig-like domain-containing protein n=1 Tax=Caerostris darwini TaxID=1538125 RepID=A0AAV4WES1_9ARAC|nr:uncharacterized protein CDAR_548311 [Caerostris darwini]